MSIFPSLVFWSALNLKDTWVLLLSVLVITERFYLLKWRRRRTDRLVGEIYFRSA